MSNSIDLHKGPEPRYLFLEEHAVKEHWVYHEVAFSGPVFDVDTGEAILDDGQRVRRDVVRHRGSVAVVPVIGDHVLLVKQFRISIGRDIIEIPAGRIDNGERPETSARRELKEELGYEAGQLMQGASYFSSVGFLDEIVHIFLASDLTRTETNREVDEKIQEVKMSIDDVKKGLLERRFEDSKTIIGLYELMSHYKYAGSESD
jgi:ADP-ribose pyrophosphatase